MNKAVMPLGSAGRGSYQSVLAGAVYKITASYHPCALELLTLQKYNSRVVKSFLIRDKIIDNLSPDRWVANGHFRLNQQRRQVWHVDEVMVNIRRRSILLQRLMEQRRRNEEARKSVGGVAPPRPADFAMYFSPKEAKGVNCWPNFWQHPSQGHLVPKPRWERCEHLGGITRVVDPVSRHATDY